MGEKIRDVYPITLIGSKLMVELNEGYSKQQGRVIHIQNNKFRYLLKEKDFYTLSSNILRANAAERFCCWVVLSTTWSVENSPT